MADILIKNMEMPEDCRDCPLQIYYMANGQTKCRVTGKILADFRKPIPFEGRAEECPLVEVPSSDVTEVKHGKWLWDGYVYDSPFACSCCGNFMSYESNYCPHCGARMRGWA